MAARLTAFLVAAIVGVTVVAGLIVGAQRDADAPIDVLVYNGRVFTGDAAAPFAEAVAIRGNRIFRVGSNREIKRLRRRATTVIDAHGGSVLPGFTDTYATLPLLSTEAAAPGPPGAPPAGGASRDAQQTALREAIEGAHRLGLTTIGAVIDGRDAIDAYEVWRNSAAGPPLRVVASLKVPVPLTEESLAVLDRLRSERREDSLFRVDAAALDVSVPPAPEPRSARDTLDTPLLPEPEQQALLTLDSRGWPVVLRVDDRRELAGALDALARVIETNPAPAAGRRHRLALSQPMALDTARLAALNVAVSVPLPAAWPADSLAPVDIALATPAPAPLDTLLPFSFPLPGNVTLVMASDTLADPRLGLHTLVTSAAPQDAAEISVDDDLLTAALATLTRDAARVQGDDRSRGTIGPDMVADIVILSADLFDLPAARLLDAVITTTIVDGKVVYDREADEPETDQN